MTNGTDEQNVFDAVVNYSTTGDAAAIAGATTLDDLLGKIVDNSDVSVAFGISGDETISNLIGDIEKLQSESINTEVTVDKSDLLEADRLQDNLNEDADTTVNVDDKELSEANDSVKTLANLATIDLIVNVAGTAVDFLKTAGEFALNPILEYDTALSGIEARTGHMLPNAERLISELYTDGWGESRNQIAGVITLADQLGIAQEDLGEATERAFEVSAVTGDDVTASLRTINNVAKEMGISYTEAADLIVTGTQEGANAAGDLQEALVEFGPKFKEMGISGEGALSIIKSGLDNGAKNASLVADGIKELGTNIGKIGTDQGITDAFTKLDSLSTIDLSGLLDAYNEGKITGDQFYQGIFDSLNEVNLADPLTAQQLGGTLIGPKVEDVGIGVFSNLETAWDENATAIEGRSETAGNTIHSNLTDQFNSAVRTIGEYVSDYLDDNFDISGFLNDLETGVSDALDTLKNGGSLTDAISVGLKPVGLDDEFAKLQNLFSDLIINLLEIVAGIQDATGNGKKADATRAQITAIATEQLPVRLAVANTDEVASILQTAIDQGVDPTAIATAASDAVTSLVEGGATKQAQALVDELGKGGQVQFNIGDSLEAGAFKQFTGLDSTTFTVPVSPEMTPEQVQQFIQDQQAAFKANGINSLTATVVPTLDTEDLQQQVTDAAQAATGAALQAVASTKSDAISREVGAIDDRAGGDFQQSYVPGPKESDQVGAALAGVSTALEDQKNKATEAQTQIDALSQTTDDYIEAIDNGATVQSGFIDTFADMAAAAVEGAADVESGAKTIDEAITDADEAVTNAISGNSIIPEFEKMSASAIRESAYTVEALQEIDNVSFANVEKNMQSLMQTATTLANTVAAAAARTAAAAASAPAVGAGGGNTTNNTTNVNINTNSVAEAAAAGSQVTNEELRGF